VLGAQTVAPVRVVSDGICSATGGTRLPVVVVSAPTPFAPFVALRPVRRWLGLVEVLLGVGLAATPAVVAASVGVPFVPLLAVVVPVVGAAAVGSGTDGDRLPLDAETTGHGVVRAPAVPGVVCCAPALALMVAPSTIAIPAMRQRPICSLNSMVFDISTS
jgi:hypothetical protein